MEGKCVYFYYKIYKIHKICRKLSCFIWYILSGKGIGFGLLSLNYMWKMTGKHVGNYLSAKEYVLKQMKNLPKKL